MKNEIYLDNAATTFPKPEQVYQALDQANREYAVNAGRGSYALARKADSLIAETRKAIKLLAHAEDMAEVIFTPSATMACNQVLGGLPWSKEDVVYVSPYEHNAVMRVLHLLQKKYGFAIEELAIDKDTLELDLEKIKYQFMQEPPSVLCITHVSNVTGYVLPVEILSEMVWDWNTVVFVDGSQALGLVPVELQGSGIDFYVFAGHKTLYGPFGIGGYIQNSQKKPEIVLAGGTGSNSLNLEMPEELPGRYEPGSMNIPAIMGLRAALREFGNTTEEMQSHRETISQKEKQLFDKMTQALSKIPEIQMYLPKNPQQQTGICSFTVEGYQSSDVGMILDEDYRIAVRCGYHCAPLIHKYLKDEGYGGTVRASVGQFHTEAEIELFVKAMEEIVRG